MLYVGLDVHQKQSTICLRNEDGKELRTQMIKGSWNCVIDELRKLGEPLAICYEASTGYGTLYDGLRPLAQRVVVAHPGQLRLIYKNKRKNDRIDARYLCKLLYLDEVPTVYVPSLSTRSWRALIEHRQRLIGRRVQVKNQLRAFLRGFALHSPYRLWTRKGLQWISDLTLPTEYDAFRRDQLLEELRHIQTQVKRAEVQLQTRADQHPGVALLQTIPGVGPRTAEAVVAYIDTPDRFRGAKQVACYFGLIPCQDASAAQNHLGHITRQGPASVRKLLTEAAWQAIRHSPRIQAKYQRLLHEDPQRRKSALVALSHFLVRVMWSMLRHNQAWRETELTPAAA